jgi:hypothetical protein
MFRPSQNLVDDRIDGFGGVHLSIYFRMLTSGVTSGSARSPIVTGSTVARTLSTIIAIQSNGAGLRRVRSNPGVS